MNRKPVYSKTLFYHSPLYSDNKTDVIVTNLSISQGQMYTVHCITRESGIDVLTVNSLLKSSFVMLLDASMINWMSSSALQLPRGQRFFSILEIARKICFTRGSRGNGAWKERTWIYLCLTEHILTPGLCYLIAKGYFVFFRPLDHR